MRVKLVALMGIVLFPAHASAVVNKCTDANGKVSYQQQPCPQQAQAERLNLDGDWQLLDEGNSGEFGSSRTFFDPSRIVTVDGYKRVAFKRNYTPGSRGTRYPDEQYYHFFDCQTGMMSPRVNDRSASPGAPDRRWDHWTQRVGPYPNIRQVFESACPGGASAKPKAATQPAVEVSDWLLIHTGEFKSAGKTYPVETYLSPSSIQAVGSYKRATFKVKADALRDIGKAEATHYYYYDCSTGRTSGPLIDPAGDRLEMADRLVVAGTMESFAHGAEEQTCAPMVTAYMKNEVLARVCGGWKWQPAPAGFNCDAYR